MKNRSFKYIFGLVLLSALFMIVGCGGGGGQSVLQQESPESAVMRISSDWRASTDSPAVVVDANNRFIRQATTQETDSGSSSSSSSSGKVIYLKDLAGGNPYKLEVVNVERNKDNPNIAIVTCRFYYDNGALLIVFNLVFDEEKWWLDGVEIEEEELGENEAYYYIYHIGPDDTEIFDMEQLKGTIGDKASAEGHEKDDNDNYVYDPDASSKTIEGKIDSTGLKLFIYYKRRTASFVVIHNFYNEGVLDESLSSKITGSGFVGEEVGSSYLSTNIPDGYETTKTPESLVINRDEKSNKFLYEYTKKSEQQEDDPDKPEEYTISGVVTDSKDSSKPVANAVIKFFIVDDNAEKGYSKFNDEEGNQVQITTDSQGKYDTSSLTTPFKAGTYLLVIEIDGYESQTIKVTLPQDSKENNYRANISL